MDDARPDERCLAFELAGTIGHDGNGGVADELSTPLQLTKWLCERSELLEDAADPSFTADEAALSAVVSIRQAVRALFARAVSPAPPSSADAHRLIPAEEALNRLNTAALTVPTTSQLSWPTDDSPQLRTVVRTPAAEPVELLTAALARSAIEFLAGPRRELLRACTAPRCVRYFLQGHGRQEFCKPSCSNRARAARHYQRRSSQV